MSLALTNHEIANIWAALKTIGPRECPDPKLRYAISKAKRLLLPLIESYQESLDGIGVQFAEKDEQGKPVSAPNGQGLLLADAHGYRQAVKILNAEPNMVEGIRAFTLDEVGAVSGTPDELFLLGPLVVE